MALVDRVASLATRVGQELKSLRISKADDSAVLHLAGNETKTGTLTFGSPPQVPVGTMVYHPVRRDDARLTDSRTPTAHVHPAGDITSGTFDVARLPVGTSSTTVAAGNDARFTDARTPTAHTHTGQQIMVASRTIAYADLASLVPLSGVALDVAATTLTGNPTITPAAGTDGQIIRLRMLASGAQRTPAVGTSVRLGTGIADRSMPIPSGQVGVFALEYLSVLGAWVLFSEYVVSAS